MWYVEWSVKTSALILALRLLHQNSLLHQLLHEGGITRDLTSLCRTQYASIIASRKLMEKGKKAGKDRKSWLFWC